MQIQRVSNQRFTGLQCCPNYGQVQYIIATKLGGESFYRTMNLVDQLAKNKTHAVLYLGGDLEDPIVCAEVGGKLFKENFFNSPFRVVKKALKLSNKLDKLFMNE